MKQNADCMRDVLVEVEGRQTFDHNNVPRPLRADELLMSELGDKYGAAEILYAVKQLGGSGLLEITERREIRAPHYAIQDITPEGHKFLQNIRSPDTWDKTKRLAAQAGSFALPVLGKIAEGLIARLIARQLGA